MRCVWPGVLAAGFLLSTISCDREASTLSQADVTEIRRMEQEIVQAALAGDIERQLALQTDDVVWLPANVPPVEGKDALRRHLAAAGGVVRFALTPLHTEGQGDLAYNRGTYALAVPVGADTVSANGNNLQVWRRATDGTWRVALAMWNDGGSSASPSVAKR